MAKVAICSVFLVSLLTGKGWSQCFSNANCTGSIVATTTDQRECCVETPDGLSFNNGSNCNVCIVHGFLEAEYNVLEGDWLNTRFQLNVKGTTQFGDAVTVNGFITATPDGTASISDFERFVTVRVIISADVRIFTVDDDVTLEYDDRVQLTFIPDSSDLVSGLQSLGEYTRDTAVVNIIDNDLLEINFGESDYSFMEDTSCRLFSAITLQYRTPQKSFMVTFSLMTVDEAETDGLGVFINSETIVSSSRATRREDFSDTERTEKIPGNSNMFTVPLFFTIEGDDIDEDEQSFAIVAEIGHDVPENISCFQTGIGETECYGRRGATEIRITDIDPMMIGFTERFQTVSEGNVPGVDLFQIQVNVASQRTAEREHPMVFRLQESSTNATIETSASSPVFDAIFGLRDSPDGPIQESRDLIPGLLTVTPLITAIRNDFVPEDRECFTLRIFPVDVPGRRELFTCNGDGIGADNYFCEHTICIEDNDEPFVVALMKTTYTVDESVGAVSVCVNLTRPEIEIDILDETVNVFVIDNSNSVYIPAGAPLATPDPPDFLSRYLMREGSDYAQQTSAVNLIDDTFSELMRIICFNQTIYDDSHLEPDEYMGLTLGVRHNPLTTVLTVVQPTYDQASILIVDNDKAVVGLKRTFYNGNETVEICAVVVHPDIMCPIKFPFNLFFSAFEDDSRVLTSRVSFDICDKSVCLNLSITDENFTFQLARTEDLDNRITLSPVAGDCGDPPEIENGLISYISFNATTTTVTYECADGYYFQEGVEYSTSRTCLTSGNWSEENILCTPLESECGNPPELQNGRISHLNETFVLYDCIDGYQFQEGIGYGTSRTCLTKGIWTNENIICITSDAECGDPPELQNGRISHLNETFVLYDCIDGYQFQEGIGYGTSRTCLTNGIWTNENIFCISSKADVDCGNPPELQNGKVRITMNTTAKNSVVIYECINGYRLHENITSQTCLASGNWSQENISCIKIDENNCEGSECTLSAGVLAAIICGAVLIPLSCFVAVAGCVVKLRLRKLKKSENILSHPSTEAGTLPLRYTTNTNPSPVQQLQEELRTKNMLIPKNQLRLGRVVGQGESGIVYCGYMKSSQGDEVVAVKTGKALLAVNDKDRLLKEVFLMLNFNHPNVMSLIGLSFEGETPLLIMPFMSKGNVLGYVREHRETLFLTDINHEKVQEANKTGLGMCYQISKGMAYLAKFKFVHRDLAARNCMIDWNGVIKVSDFGLTEDVYSYNYFRPKSTKSGEEEKLPIKWMAPESIETNVFDETTDVWSFGVTCWEVFTCGGVPYAGVPVTTLLSELRSGHRLDRPSNTSCSDDIWSVVTSCWSASPQERPKFATLVNTLTDLLDSDSNYIKLLG